MLVLKNIIYKDVEFIPVKYRDEIYYVLHVLTALDVIDYSKSVYKKLGNGFIVGLQTYAFTKELLGKNNIFKIYIDEYLQTTEIFVTDEFKETVEKSNLKGYEFTEIWSSED